jgi:hypothetical protein
MPGEFETTLTVPFNTPQTAPVVAAMKSYKPVLTGLEFFFPPGCAGLCYAALFVNGAQFMPDPLGSTEWYHGEGSVMWGGSKKIPGSTGNSAVAIEIRAYNLDDTYDHHPIARLDTEAQ